MSNNTAIFTSIRRNMVEKKTENRREKKIQQKYGQKTGIAKVNLAADKLIYGRHPKREKTRSILATEEYRNGFLSSGQRACRSNTYQMLVSALPIRGGVCVCVWRASG